MDHECRNVIIIAGHEKIQRFFLLGHIVIDTHPNSINGLVFTKVLTNREWGIVEIHSSTGEYLANTVVTRYIKSDGLYLCTLMNRRAAIEEQKKRENKSKHNRK